MPGNGNLLSFTDSVNGQWTQIGYDTLNRLTTATVAGTPSSTTLTWSYDPFGNRESQGPNGGTLSYPPGNNRISGFAYEASGNVKDDGSNQYVYDGEGRICTVYNKTMTSYTSYAYDGLGNRVAKGGGANGLSCDNNLTVTSTFIVGPNGEQLDALNANGAAYGNVFANGQLLATYQFPTSDWTYALNDWLGTKRFVANAEGALAETCTGLPFGDEQNCAGPGGDPSPQHFTGKERDAESGLDYFGARYNSSAMGRFMSPDPLGGDLTNPQSLNRYSYVLNNPLTNTDPTGMYTCTDSKDCSSKKDQALEKSLAGLRNSKDADVARAANAYGAQNKDNGVSVGFADLSKSGKGGDTVSTIGVAADGSLRANSAITLNSKDGGTDFTADVGHEGSHAADAQDVVRSGLTEDGQAIHAGMNITPYQSEQRAYGVTNSILNSANESRNYVCGSGGCLLGRGATDIPGTVDRLVGGNAIYNQGGRPMSSTNQGPSVVNGVTPKATVPSVPH